MTRIPKNDENTSEQLKKIRELVSMGFGPFDNWALSPVPEKISKYRRIDADWEASADA